jgi:hypothetical protein
MQIFHVWALLLKAWLWFEDRCLYFAAAIEVDAFSVPRSALAMSGGRSWNIDFQIHTQASNFNTLGKSQPSQMSDKKALLTGSCQCGAIAYSSTQLPTELTNCHCTTCRKLSGGPYLTFGAFDTSSLTWKTKPGVLKTTRYSPFATRSHCGDCGSPITMQYLFQPNRIGLTAGTFDRVEGSLPKVGEHIFLKEKAVWFEVPDDGIPRFEGFPDVFGRLLEEWVEGKDTLKT